MKFRGFKKTSLIEWPEHIVSVVFTGGCNFRCPYCQNSDLVLNSKSLPLIDEKEIIDSLKSERKWIDGIAVTGGEPTLHPELPNFLRRAKENGFDVCLETNGTNPNMIKKLIENNSIDYVSLDIKAPLDNTSYKNATGTDMNWAIAIETTMRVIQSIDHEIRTTVVPGIINKGDIAIITNDIKDYTDKYYLQQFYPDNTLDDSYSKVEPYSTEELEKMRDNISNYFDICKIRNL